jgi:hypothetical protein
MSNTTPQAGLFFVHKFFEMSGLSKVIDKAIGARKSRGYSGSGHIKAMVMSQICGSDAIKDQKILPERAGVLSIKIPSVSAARDYMRAFYNHAEDRVRSAGRSFTPAENEYLSGFAQIHEYTFNKVYNMRPKASITPDQDAALIPAGRPEALFKYSGERSHEAFSTYCAEYDLMIGTRYSDGNVTAGHDQPGELKKTLPKLPSGVKKVSLRSDSAGYQTELMKYTAVS